MAKNSQPFSFLNFEYRHAAVHHSWTLVMLSWFSKERQFKGKVPGRDEEESMVLALQHQRFLHKRQSTLTLPAPLSMAAASDQFGLSYHGDSREFHAAHRLLSDGGPGEVKPGEVCHPRGKRFILE